MPKSGHSAVAIGEGVDEDKLIMEHAAENQRMHSCLCCFHPIEKVVHQLRDELCRWCHKDALIAVKDAFLSTAEITRLIYDVFGHDAVEGFHILDAEGIGLGQFLIGSIGVLDFLDLFLFTKNSLAVNDISYLAQGESLLQSAEKSGWT